MVTRNSTSQPPKHRTALKASRKSPAAASNVYGSRYGLHYPCPWDVVKSHYMQGHIQRTAYKHVTQKIGVRLCGGVEQCSADD